MDMSRRRLVAGLAAFASLPGTTATRAADAFPSRTIRIIVGFPAGIGMEINTRILADRMSRNVGQPVIVENKPGASDMLAAQAVLHALHDGYTLMMINNQHYNNQLVYPKVTYNNDDFIPVAGGGVVSMVMMTSKALAATTVASFVDLARKQPKEIFYGYWGAGGSPQIMARQLEMSRGIEMTGIGYKEAASAMPDLISGRISLFFTSLTQGLPLHQADAVNFLAVGTPQRLPAIADVPTFAEAGIDDMPSPWWGYGVPAGTPADAIETLRIALSRAASSPEYRAKLADTGSTPLVHGSRAEFQAFVDREFERWAAVIRPLHLQLN